MEKLPFHQVKDILVLQLFDLKLSEQEILAYIHAVGFEEDKLKEVYAKAIEKKMPVLAKALLAQESVRGIFPFMEDQILAFVDSGRVLELEPLRPILRKDEYEDVLEVIFKTSLVSPYKKRVGLSLKTWGTRFLNNIYILSLLFDVEEGLNKIATLNHSNSIPQNVIDDLVYNGGTKNWLIEMRYSIPRVFKLLLSASDGDFYQDANRMVKVIKGACPDNYLSVFTEYVGRKPTSFREIHNRLLPKIFEIEHGNLEKIELNQDVTFLDGMDLYEFKISIPKTAADLFMTGAVLRHCVGTYVEDVLAKECCIVNLVKDGELSHTIELIPAGKSYRVGQFKGYKNADEYEGFEGTRYRKKIVQMINEIRKTAS